jgi:hypothetical protein
MAPKVTGRLAERSQVLRACAQLTAATLAANTSQPPLQSAGVKKPTKALAQRITNAMPANRPPAAASSVPYIASPAPSLRTTNHAGQAVENVMFWRIGSHHRSVLAMAFAHNTTLSTVSQILTPFGGPLAVYLI